MNRGLGRYGTEYDLSNAKRGAIVPPKPGTVELMIRLDEDLLHWLRARIHAQGGGDYRDVINQAVRDYKERAEAE
jgi:uncharacterized protein (DUF4415 family)